MNRFIGGIAALIVLCLLVAGAWFGRSMFSDRSHPTQSTQVIVPRGSTFHDIANQLASAGVIDNALTFRLFAKAERKDTAVRAGEYRFPPHLTQAQVLDQLLTGGAQIAKWVTFPEGFTAKQVATRLQEEGFGDSQRFETAFMHDTIVVGGTRTKNLEGYLFPSTYLVPVGATPQIVERIMTGQFLKELPPNAAESARAHGLTVPQVITVASLVQQEGKVDGERPVIAGVIYNRLRDRMPLQVDATLEYTLPKHKDVLTLADVRADSPYNTYKHDGLPPTPIANPGQPSILAAFDPRRSDYLYYVAKGDGHHAFATTLAQHQANVRKYLK
ncbi:MAG TPA: endolytic transglycosylase MltG [Candidatus Baltobacteraceae bacterium]